MTHPFRLLGLAAAAVTLVAACGSGPSDPSGPGGDVDPTVNPLDPWADIDTRYPSEDPVATVYGYVQAMAAANRPGACEFQYRGSSDPKTTPCVLAEEMPPRDRRFTAGDWARFAELPLTDYEPSEDARGWKVTVPDGPGVTWRIVQDDAGIWFIA